MQSSLSQEPKAKLMAGAMRVGGGPSWTTPGIMLVMKGDGSPHSAVFYLYF